MMGTFRTLAILATGAALGGTALLAYRISQETGKPLQEALYDVPTEARKLFSDVPTEARKVFSDVPTEARKVFSDVPTEARKVFSDVPGEAQRVFEDVKNRAAEAIERGREMYVEKQQEIEDRLKGDASV